jgi:DNA replication protein DnaC
MTFATPQDWKSEIWWRNRTEDERWFHANVPPRIRQQIAAEEEWAPGTSILLVGPPGSGKSVRASSLLRSAIAQGASGKWVSADDYVEMIKDSFDSGGLLPSMYTSPHLVKYIKGVFDVLVIDGLGEERRTEFATHELGSLIRTRYERMKPTIITTTLVPSDIKARYGVRLASALADMTMVVTSGRK